MFLELRNDSRSYCAAGRDVFTACLLHSIRLAVALDLALLAMQAPAVISEYQAVLLQLLRSSDQEIAQRKASGQRFYGIDAGEDERRFLSELRTAEPSNAETLAAAIDRLPGLRSSYGRIEHSADLPRSVLAAKDVAADEGDLRRRFTQTEFDSFTAQLDLSFAAAASGLVRLFVGSLLGELITAALFRVDGSRSETAAIMPDA